MLLASYSFIKQKKAESIDSAFLCLPQISIMNQKWYSSSVN
ncbi:hypothetical protein GPAL_2119 [Glaciecola pallidula DSM 14239 = ACAM 615]|uniref:Uncharacterized protein n=1 Tax=Brumicola pallidula DSM 14239 = ACAM 615 TaxID=1121922 RepID=K7A0D3_9ALTE|nr:hypothetical protein GPAL_2119 [Glaciecola pallidula DSM 14239 = ACAM 615]